MAGWRYAGEYSLYNFSEDPRATIAWAADPVNRVRAALDDDGALMAFCSYGPDGRVPGWDYDESMLDVGAGLRPALTGNGLGKALLEAVLRYAAIEFGERRLRVTIASWNERALTVCGRVGFVESGTFASPHGLSFTVLTLDWTDVR